MRVRFIGPTCLSQTKKAGEVVAMSLTGLDKATQGQGETEAGNVYVQYIDFAPVIPIMSYFPSTFLAGFPDLNYSAFSLCEYISIWSVQVDMLCKVLFLRIC